MTDSATEPRRRRRKPRSGRPSRSGLLPDVPDKGAVEQTALGLLISEAIAAKSLTVRAAARRCGISAGTMSHYKTGRILGHEPGTLRKIAVGLGIPLEQLTEAAGDDIGESDAETLMRYFRRLPAVDRQVAVEVVRALARAARERGIR